MVYPLLIAPEKLVGPWIGWRRRAGPTLILLVRIGQLNPLALFGLCYVMIVETLMVHFLLSNEWNVLKINVNAPFVRASEDPPRAETIKEANRGGSRADASFVRASEDPPRAETNGGGSRAAMACVVRDMSDRLLDRFSRVIEASSLEQAEASALVGTLTFLLPRSTEN